MITVIPAAVAGVLAGDDDHAADLAVCKSNAYVVDVLMLWIVQYLWFFIGEFVVRHLYRLRVCCQVLFVELQKQRGSKCTALETTACLKF